MMLVLMHQVLILVIVQQLSLILLFLEVKKVNPLQMLSDDAPETLKMVMPGLTLMWADCLFITLTAVVLSGFKLNLLFF